MNRCEQVKRRMVLALAGLLAGFCSPAFANDHREWQYWNEFVAEHEFSSNWRMEVSLEQNQFDDFREFGLYNIQIRPFYKMGGPLSLGCEYRYERELDEGKWITEHRIGLIPVLQQTWEDWQLKLITTVEYRYLDEGDEWRWREKLKVARTCRIGQVELMPWVSGETFYSFRADERTQNRASFGLSKELPGGVEVTLYYMLRADKDDPGWVSTHVVGTEFAIKW